MTTGVGDERGTGLRLLVPVPHVEIDEVIAVPAVNCEDNEDEEIRNERERFSGCHRTVGNAQRVSGEHKRLVYMNPSQLRNLLDAVKKRGDRHRRCGTAVDSRRSARRPFEDLGFARVDHHRAIRQGFPEVVLGLGKTPAQIAAIAAALVGRGSSLLVTRASQAAFDAVRVVVPQATFYAEAGIIAFKQGDVAPGKGRILVAAAGTSDLPLPRKRRTRLS